MKYLLSLVVIATLSLNVKSQELSISAGTDFPYQHYLGISLQSPNTEFYYRSGVLVPPYSDIILGTIEKLGTAEIYINILESAYDFGWMNSLGASFSFGKEKKWYAGPEFRLDFLTASHTPADQVESLLGRPIISIINPIIELNTELGLTMYAAGLRLGRSFVFGDIDQYSFNIELSFAKHIETQSLLTLNDQHTGELNKLLDGILWEDVFKKYGYIGGVGISFRYSFNQKPVNGL